MWPFLIMIPKLFPHSVDTTRTCFYLADNHIHCIIYAVFAVCVTTAYRFLVQKSLPLGLFRVCAIELAFIDTILLNRHLSSLGSLHSLRFQAACSLLALIFQVTSEVFFDLSASILYLDNFYIIIQIFFGLKGQLRENKIIIRHRNCVVILDIYHCSC